MFPLKIPTGKKATKVQADTNTVRYMLSDSVTLLVDSNSVSYDMIYPSNVSASVSTQAQAYQNPNFLRHTRTTQGNCKQRSLSKIPLTTVDERNSPTGSSECDLDAVIPYSYRQPSFPPHPRPAQPENITKRNETQTIIYPSIHSLYPALPCPATTTTTTASPSPTPSPPLSLAALPPLPQNPTARVWKEPDHDIQTQSSYTTYLSW